MLDLSCGMKSKMYKTTNFCLPYELHDEEHYNCTTTKKLEQFDDDGRLLHS